MDGNPGMYFHATQGAASTSLAGRANQKCAVALNIYESVQDSSSGVPRANVIMSGMQVSQITWNFPNDGNFTEDCTLVGNHKIWDTTAPFLYSGNFLNTDTPTSIAGSGGVNRREDMLFSPTISGIPANLDANGALADPNATILPAGAYGGIPGLHSSGVNPLDSDGNRRVCVTNITVSCNLGREELFCLGRKTPSCRFLTFPTEVTCDIEVLSCSGDLVDATEDGVAGGGNNLADKSIRVAIREGLRLNLGTKNKLQSVTYTGGDTGGGQVTSRFSYRNFNSLAAAAWYDVTAALRVNQL